MTVLDSFKSKTVAVFLVMAALVSCSPANPNISTDRKLAKEVTDNFTKGKIIMTCRFSCLGPSGRYMNTQRKLYDEELWGELAELTIRIGWKDNLQYYYLGRSAEGLGFKKAAKIYYKKALNENNKCAWGSCTGLDVPSLAKQRLKNL
jgi:hypothetical protein